MKLIHLSDLHLGKRVNGYSMLEDQEYILRQILTVIAEERPAGVLIAGDIYDKPVPPAEAVELFDHFLVQLAQMGQKIFLISGNHDSAERLSFGGRLMAAGGVYVSPVYRGPVPPIYLEDAYGKAAIYLLPFVKPTHIRRWHPDAEVTDYTSALRIATDSMAVDPAIRNVLVTHQFLAGTHRCESEEISIGGLDSVDASVFDAFDYVAAGHLHGPQQAGRSTLRYCGTPLKYSFSEAQHQKSVTVVELAEKGSVSIRTVPLTPLRDLREIRGTFAELTEKAFYAGTSLPNDYLHITLTDEEEVPDAIGRLQKIYHNIMKLHYDNQRTRSNAEIVGAEHVESKTPLQLFSELYEKQNNQPMSETQKALTSELIQEIWEDTV